MVSTSSLLDKTLASLHSYRIAGRCEPKRTQTAPVRGSSGPTSIDRVGIRIPPFWASDPEMWFTQIENQFALAKETSDETKFHYVARNMDSKYATEVRDILANPPATNKYTFLKTELIRRLSSSQKQKTRRLLEHEEIGDCKPSQFLHLRGLAGTVVCDSVLHALWTRRLPPNMQAILATQKDATLDKVAERADAIADSTPRNQVAKVSENSFEAWMNMKMSQIALMFTQELAAFRQEISALAGRGTANGSPRREHRPRPRSRSTGRGHGKDGFCWYHWRFDTDAKNCEALVPQVGKRPGRSLIVTSDPGPTSLRLFVTDQDSKIRFLVDTGADLCVFPRTMVREPREKSTYELWAATETTIATYGIITLTLNLGLRRVYTWKFVIADVSKPIIGVDFLAHYELLVDVRNHQLLDAHTLLTVWGQVAECSAPSIKTVSGTSPYHELLQTFPEITRPDGISGTPKHTT